jgi:hypothetical protein
VGTGGNGACSCSFPGSRVLHHTTHHATPHHTPQVKVFTQQNGVPVLWDTQWTGDDGTAEFYLVPG